MLFYYVRHGDPVYETDGLTETGKKQAAALAGRLTLYGLDEIYCSTAGRARMTAEPTCRALGIEPVLLDWTNEKYPWEELTVLNEEKTMRHWLFQLPELYSKMKSPEVRAAGAKWYDHEYFRKYGFGKGIERVDRETDKFFLSLGFRHDREYGRYEIVKENGKRVALFAHQGFGEAFLSSLLDIPYPAFCTRFDFGHSSVTVIDFETSDGKYVYPRVLQLSNDSHLYKEGILTGYNNEKNI